MSQKAGYSPSFKRPTEIMRMMRKRTRSEAGADSNPSGLGSTGSQSHSNLATGLRPFLPSPRFAVRNNLIGGKKRRNPFSNIENTFNPKKKAHIDSYAEDSDGTRTSAEETGDVDVDVPAKNGGLSVSSRLHEVATHRERDNSCKKSLTFAQDDSLFEESKEDTESHLLQSPQTSVSSSDTSICVRYPADWSIKTRLLFTSPLSLSWAENLKAQEEALSLSQHCKAQFTTLTHTLQDPRSCSELRCAFQQSLIYWQHPSMSWLSLFPRINAERSFTGKSAPWTQDTALQQNLMTEWSVSLSSLYGLLKAKLCPYFYVCSYQFTVLFRAAGLSGSGCISALISPTTRGLREAMKAEGIQFSLPLVEGKGNEQVEKDECSVNEELVDTGDGDPEDEDSSLSWLKEMGVHDKIKKPDCIKMQLHKEGHIMSLDHKPESVVYVEGACTFTLINFLINCKSVVAVAGSQAGLPPTLLAPVAFRGATMQLLKAHSVNVQSQVGSTYQNISSLEISGPILPSALHTITTLLQLSQKGNFSASVYTHAPTAVMNVHCSTQQSSDGPVDLSCGVHPLSLEQLQQPSTLGKTALTRINMCNHSYTWNN
ncbi:protein downstream neighbor of Son isoform X1 [Synchiropus splendidus]|uniref:protein downstream neighbor of Son isoform X1 n=1 Tax=Synchiropus splendidus TaxID=270530 RepID=UPI00237EB529|nr:protein downstream neighbor of Son isoform X1 [Synchiropus splendidus]